MSKFKVGIIGCGGRGRSHAVGYASSNDVVMVACADPVEDNARKLAEQHDIPATYSDYRDMLKKEALDVVSVCTWTGLHTQMILDAVDSGVKAIHSEKPMAPTWGEAKKQHETCVANNVQLTYSHQRRFGRQFYKAKLLANDGTIGKMIRVEGSCPNMFDWGTHWFDMFFFYNNDEPAEWVIAQIDPEGTHDVFGVPVEGGGVSWIRWKNGLQGLLVTGHAGGVGCANRIIGTEGIIEVGVPDGPAIRVMSGGSDWQIPDMGDFPFSGGNDTTLGVLDAIQCLKTGEEPVLSSRKALQATELIFATYESSRRRAKIVLPLDVDDSALMAMLESGTLQRR